MIRLIVMELGRFISNPVILFIFNKTINGFQVLLKECRTGARFMADVESIAPFTITVFTRHTAECPKAGNPQWKRRDCRKSLYIREGGKTRYVTAKTRSWEEAERYAQAERDKRDPVKIELQEIAEQEAAKVARDVVQLKSIGEALEQWQTGMKGPGATSINSHRSTTRKIQRWADRVGVACVSDVTPDMLDQWRSS